jgi:hypothetical protein
VETVLPPVPQIPRPKVVILIPILVTFSVIVSLPSLFLSMPHDAEVRRGLAKQLAKQADDYSASDVRTAVLVGVILVLALCVIFSIAEIRSSLRLFHKRRASRTVLLWLASFHLPLIAFAPQVRDIGRYDELSAWVQGISLALAVALAFWYQTGRWLTAVTRQGPIPLRPTPQR